MKKEKNLSELAVAESGVVYRLCYDGNMHRRFLDVGLIPGTRVVCVGKSPFGDPRAYLVRGTRIAIRNADARGIILED